MEKLCSYHSEVDRACVLRIIPHNQPVGVPLVGTRIDAG